MISHPWHEVETNFREEESLIHGIIEISQGSKAKYEVDKATGLLRLDRVIFAAFHYPINYGFIPRTLGEDGDPLDILVLSQVNIEPLCLVNARIIGIMAMTDTGVKDEKIIAVAQGDASVSHIFELDQLPVNFLEEIRHFFNHYKNLEKKEVTADRFDDRQSAFTVIQAAIARYAAAFPL